MGPGTILQSVTKIERLVPLAPLFNVGCKFVWSFLTTTTWHSFSRLGITSNQGEGGILGIFNICLGLFHENIVSPNNFCD